MILHSWLPEFDIFPHNFISVYVNEIINYSVYLKPLLNRCSNLFTGKIGEIKKIVGKLYIDKDATPTFCKAITVKYGLP